MQYHHLTSEICNLRTDRIPCKVSNDIAIGGVNSEALVGYVAPDHTKSIGMYETLGFVVLFLEEVSKKVSTGISARETILFIFAPDTLQNVQKGHVAIKAP